MSGSRLNVGVVARLAVVIALGGMLVTGYRLFPFTDDAELVSASIQPSSRTSGRRVGASAHGASPQAAPGNATSPSSWDSLAVATQVGIERAMAANDDDHRPRMDHGAPVLGAFGTPSARFTADGATIEVGGQTLTLRAASMTRSDGAARAEALTATSSPTIVGPEVRTERGFGVTEWWRSLPSGLEHGMTLAVRPPGQGELTLELSLEGTLVLRAESDDVVEFVDPKGRVVARYASLVVLDATGAAVPAQMSVRGERIALRVDDAGARYPLVVDPLLYGAEEAVLYPSDGEDFNFGWSVALSADGTRALVGIPFDDVGVQSNVGSARVFVRTGSSWTEEATLLAGDGAFQDRLGYSVALSADGSRALVGVPNDDNGLTTGGPGSARVFARTGSSWTEEATLVSPDATPGDQLGTSVSISADGSRALVGAHTDVTGAGTGAGSAHVFMRSATTWAHEAMLEAPDAGAGDYFGFSVALSADGSRALVGAYAHDTTGGANAGAAYVFSRSGTSWTNEAALLAPDGSAADQFGWSVAISTDGSRALVSGYMDDTGVGYGTGSAHVFLQAGGSWTHEAMLVASDAKGGDYFGYSVALSGDGSRALIGVYGDDTPRGADLGSARVFERTSGGWSEETTFYATNAPTTGESFGYAVALAADGTRALFGVPYDHWLFGYNAGGARVYALSPSDADGTSCTTGSTCSSGFCVDGVCCDSACGGGSATDCQACADALTGAADGTCSPLSASAASSVTCRGSTGVCDPAEFCSPSSTVCPSDTMQPATTECRPSAGACDAAEMCTGVAGECPPDAPASANTVCRASAGTCDVAEVCDGNVFSCPDDALLPTGTTCRAAAGACDVAETCDGSLDCPGDGFTAQGTECRAASGVCDLAESCTGLAPDCPNDVTVADGTSCDDGSVCTSGGSCQSGACATSASLDCNDGDACTLDACDAQMGCMNTPVVACVLDGGLDAGDGSVGDGGDVQPRSTDPGGCACRVGERGLSGPDWVMPLSVSFALFIRQRRRRR